MTPTNDRGRMTGVPSRRPQRFLCHTGITAVFAAKVAAEIDRDSLELILKVVSESADEMEEKITGADEF